MTVLRRSKRGQTKLAVSDWPNHTSGLTDRLDDNYLLRSGPNSTSSSGGVATTSAGAGLLDPLDAFHKASADWARWRNPSITQLASQIVPDLLSARE